MRTASETLDLLHDPDLVAETAYRQIHESLEGILTSGDEDAVAIALGELDNFVTWAQSLDALIRGVPDREDRSEPVPD